jgi:hypothetical protein
VAIYQRSDSFEPAAIAGRHANLGRSVAVLCAAYTQSATNGAADASRGRLDATALASLGRSASNPPYGVVGAAPSDSLVDVANSGSHELRVHAIDGKLSRAVGRQGDGPGEFTVVRDDAGGQFLVVAARTP